MLGGIAPLPKLPQDFYLPLPFAGKDFYLPLPSATPGWGYLSPPPEFFPNVKLHQDF